MIEMGQEDPRRAAKLAELAHMQATSDMVTPWEGHGCMPARLAVRGPESFDNEASLDRDSADAAELARLVTHLDEVVKAWADFNVLYPDPAEIIEFAQDMADTWAAIRDITQNRKG